MYQNVTLIGRLGRDPEMRFTPNGDPVTNFAMATDREFKDKSGSLQRETTWWRITVFGNQAEACNKYLKKGKLVLVVGNIKPDRDTGGPTLFDKKDGTKGAAFELIANTVRFMSAREDQSEEPVQENG